MPLLANARLSSMLHRETKEMFYGDTAFLYIDTETSKDSYGQPVVSTVTMPIECSFTDKVSPELWKDFADVAEFVAEIRFDEPEPHKGNRIKLATHFENEYIDKEYEIAGIRDRGTFGFVCALKAVSI